MANVPGNKVGKWFAQGRQRHHCPISLCFHLWLLTRWSQTHSSWSRCRHLLSFYSKLPSAWNHTLLSRATVRGVNNRREKKKKKRQWEQAWGEKKKQWGQRELLRWGRAARGHHQCGTHHAWCKGGREGRRGRKAVGRLRASRGSAVAMRDAWERKGNLHVVKEKTSPQEGTSCFCGRDSKKKKIMKHPKQRVTGSSSMRATLETLNLSREQEPPLNWPQKKKKKKGHRGVGRSKKKKKKDAWSVFLSPWSVLLSHWLHTREVWGGVF